MQDLSNLCFCLTHLVNNSVQEPPCKLLLSLTGSILRDDDLGLSSIPRGGSCHVPLSHTVTAVPEHLAA